MISRKLFQSENQEWTTPAGLYKELDAEFHFTLDAASTDENAKCKKHFTVREDGLKQPWKNEVVFCNPPYNQIKAWAKKCLQEFTHGGATIVFLVPARTDTAWFHDYVYPFCKIRFIRGRLRFGQATENAPFPSMICIYKQD